MSALITFDFDFTLFKNSDEKVGMLWAAQDVMVPIQPIYLLNTKYTFQYFLIFFIDIHI